MEKIILKHVSNKFKSIGIQGGCTRKGGCMIVDGEKLSEHVLGLIESGDLEVVKGKKSLKSMTPREITDKANAKMKAEKEAKAKAKADEAAAIAKEKEDLKKAKVESDAKAKAAVEADRLVRVEKVKEDNKKANEKAKEVALSNGPKSKAAQNEAKAAAKKPVKSGKK